jgi:predicted CopG family antitoxin
MNLEDYYKKFNFPASSTFLKLLKNEGLKYTKDEVDKFIKGKTEQQQTTIKTEKKKDLGIFEDWELLIDYNPNLSEQEAKDKIQELKSNRMKSVVMVDDAN